MGDIADSACKVLVGKVRDRTYTTDRLGKWVKEISG